MPSTIITPQTWPKPMQMLLGIGVENWVRYALFAGVAWVLGYWVFKRRWWGRKIIQREPAGAEVVGADGFHLRGGGDGNVAAGAEPGVEDVFQEP